MFGAKSPSLDSDFSFLCGQDTFLCLSFILALSQGTGWQERKDQEARNRQRVAALLMRPACLNSLVKITGLRLNVAGWALCPMQACVSGASPALAGSSSLVCPPRSPRLPVSSCSLHIPRPPAKTRATPLESVHVQ